MCPKPITYDPIGDVCRHVTKDYLTRSLTHMVNDPALANALATMQDAYLTSKQEKVSQMVIQPAPSMSLPPLAMTVPHHYPGEGGCQGTAWWFLLFPLYFAFLLLHLFVLTCSSLLLFLTCSPPMFMCGIGMHTVPYIHGCTVPYYGHSTRTIKGLCAVLTVRYTVRFDTVYTVQIWPCTVCIRHASVNAENLLAEPKTHRLTGATAGTYIGHA
ncbi:hypothetical protein JB92DRAFT_593553 [Gautieria morchelliformis]|nr:hypothetical protein JB92DRAFT_593553 [Gautieria morchelliformis]